MAGRKADVCGIAGCYQQADGRKLVDIMSERIAHRGPDASGSWYHETEGVSVQFGFRNLECKGSLSKRQPLHSDFDTFYRHPY